MTLLRTRLMLAALCATLLMGLAVPATNAYMPHATRYRVGGAITLDTNLLSASGASAWAIDEYLSANTPLPALGSAFMAAERKYGINARFLLAAALHESGWGTSDIARFKHNLFGYNAYDRDPFKYASAFDTYAANIDATAKFIKDFYLTRTGRWWGGQPTLRSMQQFWSSSQRWGQSVAAVANSLNLDAFNGRAIRVGAPVVPGRLHVGDRASVQVAWSGGSLPAGVQFVATWTPVALDADVIAAALASAAAAAGDPLSPAAATGSPSPASPAPATSPVAPGASPDPAPTASAGSSLSPVAPTPSPTPAPAGDLAPPPATTAAAGSITATPASPNRPSVTVGATRARSTARGVTLSIPTPRLPGQYLLSVDVRDTGGTPLPKSELIRVPAVSVRVWGDQSMSVSLTASPDGEGAIVSLTNTGRQLIAAQPALDPLAPNDPEGKAHTTLTVTATTADPANPSPVVLLSMPLASDLKPGASASFQVPGIAAATGRAGNWLSSSLTIPGNPSWLLAYAPAGAWLEGGQLSSTIPSDVLGQTGSRALVGPVPRETAAPSMTPTPSATPVPTVSPTPAATPTLALTTAMPPPSAMPTPAPTATPTPTPAPVRHGTWTYSEHSSAIAYRGAWRDAGSPAYMGGNVAWSTTPGATATFTFTGSSVTWVGPMGPTRGRALVLIDGHAVATISLWRSDFIAQVALFSRSFRSVGRHTLTIEVLSSPGHPYVAIDGFVVRS